LADFARKDCYDFECLVILFWLLMQYLNIWSIVCWWKIANVFDRFELDWKRNRCVWSYNSRLVSLLSSTKINMHFCILKYIYAPMMLERIFWMKYVLNLIVLQSKSSRYVVICQVILFYLEKTLIWSCWCILTPNPEWFSKYYYYPKKLPSAQEPLKNLETKK